MRRPATLSTDLLTIYLNDHLAGATVGQELAQRTLAANRGTEFETFLSDLAGAISEDRRELEAIMRRLDVPSDPVKVSAGWLTEKVGRLKLNGRLRGYSPLSRVLELEGLSSGVHAKLALWRALKVLAAGEPRLNEDELDRLIERAEGQLEDLAAQQARAAERAFEPYARAASSARTS